MSDAHLTVLKEAVSRHARHEPTECDCDAATILLVLALRDIAEALVKVDWEKIAAALSPADGAGS